MRQELQANVMKARLAFTSSPSMGLMTCRMPNCDQVTRIRLATTGEPVCMTCGRASIACVPRDWAKPKGFRLSRRPSNPTHIVLRDGPLNGSSVRRATKLAKAKKKKGDRGGAGDSTSGSLISWRTGFIRLVVTHPTEGPLLGLSGSQVLPVTGAYVYDSTDDSYWWYA